MKRRAARELAFQLTYEMVMTDAFNTETKAELLANADGDSRGYVESVIAGIEQHKAEIKALIIKYARGYEFDRIYKTDLAVLYLACYEIMFTYTPKAVVANEAVEIAKAYSDTQSYSFVNGILASVIKGESANE
ncbi:MAG: transcription antitermination factor NusB [Clostridiales bacterium]|nr:transcription antitermination factor NusB [Clostridiales bacterium]